MNDNKQAVVGFIRGVEDLFDCDYSQTATGYLCRRLSEFSIVTLSKVFTQMETGDLKRAPDPKTLFNMCKGVETTTKTDHAYQLGRKFRTGNIAHNPYKWIERRGESCAALLLYFQKGWSDQDTDLTLSVS